MSWVLIIYVSFLLLLFYSEMLEQLGNSKSEQRETMQDKLRRKRELLAQRKAGGLSTDDAVLEAILEEELQEEPSKKRVSLRQRKPRILY